MISKEKIHNLGPEFSRLIYGVWRLNEDPAGSDVSIVQRKIEYCLDHGITTFDHADIYGGYSCEEIFGRVLGANKALSQKMQIVTKCGIMLVSNERPSNRIKHYNTSKEHIVGSVETSLKNLKVDKIDLLLIHRPSPILNPEEVGEAFRSLRDSGKVLHFGVSNFLPDQFQVLQSVLDFPLVTNQIEVHPFMTKYFHDGTLNYLLERKISPMIWSPLAGGRIFLENDSDSYRLMRVLERMSKEKSFHLEEILLKWLIYTPYNMFPIIGTNKLDRIQKCLRFEEVPMDSQDWFEIYSAASGEEVP
jgi:predicted oxidoreductase